MVPRGNLPQSSLRSERLRRIVNRIPFVDREVFLQPDLLPTGGTMVDVGAAGGTHAIAGARHVGPTGTVVALEPRPGSAAILRRWRDVLGLDQMTVLACAVADEPGTMQLRTPLVPTRSHASGGDDGTLLARLPALQRTLSVSTLDLVVRSRGLTRLDLVKIDVEGGEAKVLAGATTTIERFHPAILIEMHDPFLQRDGTSARQVHDWLVDRGYRGHVDGPAGVVPIDGPHESIQNHLYLPTRR